MMGRFAKLVSVLLLVVTLSALAQPVRAADAGAMAVAAGLRDAGHVFDRAAPVLNRAGSLPLTALNPFSDTALPIHTVLRKLLSDGLNDNYASLDELALALKGRSGTYDHVLTIIDAVTLQQQGLHIDGQFTLTARRAISPTLTLTAAPLQLDGGTLPLTLSLTLPLSFRLDLAQTNPNLAFALVGTPLLRLNGTSAGVVNRFSNRLGFLGVDVGGNANIATEWDLAINDPDRDGSITLDEMQSTAPEDLLTLTIAPGAHVDAALAMTAMPLSGSTHPFVDGPPATLTLTDTDLRDGLSAPTVNLGPLADFTHINAAEMLSGLYDLSTALVVAQAATDPQLPLLRDRLSASFTFADPLIAFVRQQGEAAIFCGRTNTDPPTGDVSNLPAGTTIIYCQATTRKNPVTVHWSATNGSLVAGQQGDVVQTVGEDPRANVAITVNGPGAPRVTVHFTDPADGTTPGATHQVAFLFRTAQELFGQLRDLGGFALDPADVHYDPPTASLTYRLHTRTDPPAFKTQIAVGDQLAAATGLKKLQSTNAATATIDPSDVGMNVIFGTLLVQNTTDITSGSTLADRFFVQIGDDTPALTASAAISANVDLAGRLGPLEVHVSGDPSANPVANDNAGLLLTRADPSQPLLAIHFVAPAAGLVIKGRPNIPRALSLPTLLLHTKDVVQPHLNMRLSGGLLTTSQIGNPPVELARGSIGLTWADVAQGTPSILPDTAFLQRLKAFDSTPDRPRAVLDAVINQLDALATAMQAPASADAREMLDSKLPLTDVSVRDLLPQTAAVHQLADSLRANTPDSLQALQREIVTQLGVLSVAVQFTLDDLPGPGGINGDGVADLVVRVGYHLCTIDNRVLPACASVDKSIPQPPTRLLVFLDEQRGLVGKTADASLPLEFDSRLQLDMAVPLTSNATPMALNSSAATVRAAIATDQLNIRATLGALAVQAQGNARVAADVRLALAPTSATTLRTDDFGNTLQATITAPGRQQCSQVNGQDFGGMACAHLTISAVPGLPAPTAPNPVTPPTLEPTTPSTPTPNAPPTPQPTRPSAPSGATGLPGVYLPLIANATTAQAQRASVAANRMTSDRLPAEAGTTAENGSATGDGSTAGAPATPATLGEIGFATDHPMTQAVVRARTGWTSTMSAALADQLANAPLDWTELPNALDASLNTIETTLTNAAKLPLIGDKLDAGADVVQKTRDHVVTPLREIVAGFKDATSVGTITDAIQRGLAGKLGDLLVDGPDADTILSPADLRVVLSCGGAPCANDAMADQVDDIRLTFSIGSKGLNGTEPSKTLCASAGNPSLCEEGTPLPINLGLPGLPLWLTGEIKAKFGWKMLVDFGLKRGDTPGPYLVVGGAGHGTNDLVTTPTENIPELRIGTSAQLGSNPSLCSGDLPEITNATEQPGLQGFSTERCLTGKLGFLGLTVRDGDNPSDTSDENDPTSLNLLTSLDLPATNGDRVMLPNIITTAFKPELRLDADANIDLRFRTSIGGEAALPSVLGTFHVTWNWSFNNPDVANQNPSDISFRNLYLDSGTFISDFLLPITSQIRAITSPLQPVIDILRAPLPGLSDLNHLLGGGDITLLSLAGSIEQTKLVTDLVDFVDFVAKLPNKSDHLLIPLGNSPGSFVINEIKARTGEAGPSRVTELIKTVTDFRNDTLLDDIRCPSPASCRFQEPPDILTFPFLEHPQQIIDLLLGSKDVKFVKFDPGILSVDVHTTWPFPPIPIFPPVFLQGSIGFGFGITGHFAMGYDSNGLVKAFGIGSAASLMEGLFIDDSVSASGDAPELALSGKITAELAGSALILEAGIEGFVDLSATLDLDDPNNDGVLHFDEIADKLSNPICLFKVGGKLDVGIAAFFKVDLVLFDKKWSTDIFRATIIDLDAKACGANAPRPVLATVENGNLVLNMGSKDHRDARLFLSDEENEAFTVRQLTPVGVVQTADHQRGTKFSIAAFGAYEEHIIPDGGTILADGDTGDDTIALLPGVDSAGTPIPFTVSATLAGGSGNDQMQSGDGDDTFSGGEGDDILNGGKGKDTLNGDAGNDKLNGASGDDTITGGDGNDAITGGAGADTLDGSDGDDVIQGGPGTSADPDGNDTISGGVGNDSLRGDDGDDTIYGDEPLTCEADGAAFDSNKDGLLGGPGDDHLFGGSGSDGIYGNAGNDALCGNGGNDELYGDQGQQITADDGHDVLDGGTDNDLLRGNGGDDDLFGRAGDDTLLGETGNDNFSGGLGRDTLHGDDGRDYLFGDDGFATRAPGQADATAVTFSESVGDGDLLVGGDGDDVAYGEGGGDEISGDAGQDTLFGNGGDDLIRGGLANDLMFGNADNDQLFGDSGNDRMVGNDGNDRLRGGIGDDYVEGNSGADDITGDADQDDLIGGSSVAGANDANVSISPDAPPRGDHISGNAASDVLAGDNGQITRPGGVTTYDGSVIRLVTLFDRDNTATFTSSDDYLEGNEANDLLYGQGGNDTLHGNTGDDYAEGNAGDDTIYGDENQDDLVGGSNAGGLPDGNDTLYGGNGQTDLANDFDVLVGDNAQITRPLDSVGHWQFNTFNPAIRRTTTLLDQAISGGAPVRADTSGKDTLRGEAGDDTLYGQGNDDTLHGGAGSDYAEGNAANDTLYGGAGQDDLIGGSAGARRLDGNDRLWGGDGTTPLADDHDVLAGDNVMIMRPLTFGAWQTNLFDGSIRRQVTLLDEVFIGDTVDTSISGADQLNGEGGNDRIYGQGMADQARGGGGDDYIEGNADNDSLYGGAGQDDLVGGSGAPGRIDGDDQLWGGDGASAFTNDHDVIAGDNAAIMRPLLCGQWQMAEANQSIIRNVTLFEVTAVERSVVVRGNDQISGESGDDRIYGQGGDDTVSGGAGDDTIEGNADNDTLDGDDGNDNIVGGTGRINNDGQQGVNGRLDGRDTISGGAGYDVLAGDNAILARVLVNTQNTPACSPTAKPATPISISGHWVHNTFNGGIAHEPRILLDLNSPDTGVVSGDDQISGDADDDLIYGQAGNDDLRGGDGDDLIEGNAGSDSIAGGTGDDDLTGGTTQADVFDDVPDTIRGEAGDDTIAGDNATITRPLDAKGQWQRGATGRRTRTVLLFNILTNKAAVDPRRECRDVIEGGTGRDQLLGQGGDDQLDGGEDGDYLEGNAGADTLRGSGGIDVLIGGGSGADGKVGSGTNLSILVDAPNLIDGGGDGDRIILHNGVLKW